MASEVEIVHRSGDVTVARFRETLLVHFRGHTLASAAVALRKARTAIAEAYPRFAFFAVVEAESTPPDQEARRAFVRFFEESAPSLDCLVLAFRGQGFRGAVVRSVVSNMLDLMPRARFAFPRHVVGSVEEAASLVHRHSPGVDTAALIQAFRALTGAPPGS